MQSLSATTSSTVSDLVTLQARTVQFDASNFVFQYKLINKSKHPIYSYSLLHRQEKTGAERPDSNLVYCFLGDDGVVEFRKALLEVPPWAVVEAPEEPFLARIEKDAELDEVIRVKVPVTCHDPYDENYPTGYAPSLVTGSGWRLSVGFIPNPAGVHLNSEVVSGKQVFTASYSEGIRQQTLVTSPIFVDKLPVLKPAHLQQQEFLKQSNP